MTPAFAIVIPTIGRASLGVLLGELNRQLRAGAPAPQAVVLADDRPDPRGTPAGRLGGEIAALLHVVRTGGVGPGRARNRGWRAAVDLGPVEWIVFVDDDIVPGPCWLDRLADDLAGASPEVGAVQGLLSVPGPAERRPTEWERGLAGLADAKWVTGDIAYRSSALLAVGGFDERFHRNYREDSDLALRTRERGYRLTPGTRRCVQTPVPEPGRWWILRAQAGNADDALMYRLHGAGWQERAEVPRGRRPRHLATTTAALPTPALAPVHRRAALVAGTVWAAATAELTLWRIRRGDRGSREITVAVLSSPLLPFVATYHWFSGLWRHRRVRPWRSSVPGDLPEIDQPFHANRR